MKAVRWLIPVGCLLLGLTQGLLLPLAAGAQGTSSRAQLFRVGVVVLNSGDTLRGPVQLFLDRDALAVTMPDSTVRTVSAVAVQTFAVRSPILPRSAYYALSRMGNDRARRLRGPQRYRQFLVYRWNHDRPTSNFTSPAFFERLNGGPVLLLRRRYLVERTSSRTLDNYTTPANRPTRPMQVLTTYTDVSDRYYLATPAGAIVALRRPKRDLLAYFPAQAQQLEAFASQHKLSFDTEEGLARLVDFANLLNEPSVQ
ncbi:hypothetical protein F0P96_11830 [Hymenobacter busanensis]|uniref:Uncharacterized protein n=1 Tax=Hymenobacter busanensis TaxID=2607656 RepID=A0A7L4ZZB9_9BACT|nr:hypothetical protein [Hymenobacter busanensis]KAA9332169.1 hypothetical protein F0P96_11830 [Hymenobacter busanensis]QHJ07492.1 hypothetical protein GUY19_09440 [Hymenobacter busanensis]